MNVIALPKDQYGTFYDTDSYVVYSAAQYGRPMGVETIVRIIDYYYIQNFEKF